MESYDYDEQLQEMQELKEAGYSMREIGEQMGISKSKVHRILQEAKEFDTSDDDDEPSQKDKNVSQTLSQKDKKPSQNVSQTLERTEKDSENRVLVLDKQQKRHSFKLKEKLENLVREFLGYDNYTSDELSYFITSFSSLKTEIEDLIYDAKDFIDDGDWFYPNELNSCINTLEEAKKRMETLSKTRLKNDKDYFFGIRTLYSSDDEDEYSEQKEENVIERLAAVDLFKRVPSKKYSFSSLIQDTMGIV